MKTTAILAILLSLTFTGCNNTSEIESDTSNSVNHSAAMQTEKQEWNDKIQLNKGVQWQANKETSEGISTMLTLLESTSPASVEDYRNLGMEMTEEVNTLIKGCTMEGPSHNNLHIYLEPLIVKIAQLREVRSKEKGNGLTSELKEHLQAYGQYFD